VEMSFESEKRSGNGQKIMIVGGGVSKLAEE
jgi:hypothetical protein